MEEREFCFVLWGKPFSLRKRSRPSLVLPDRAHQKWLLDGRKEGQPASPPLMVCGEYGGREEGVRRVASCSCTAHDRNVCSFGKGARPRVKRLSDRRGVRWVNKCLGRAGETELARSLNQPALAP